MSRVEDSIKELICSIDDRLELVQTFSYLENKKREKVQILVDISGIKRYDSQTGIPRVVKNQLQTLQQLYGKKQSIRAIYLDCLDEHWMHFYDDDDTPVFLQKGDIVYNPDLDPSGITGAKQMSIFKCYKNLGVKIVTLVHDMLPITHPQFFVDGQDVVHREWFETVMEVSDTLVVTTKATLEVIEKLYGRCSKCVVIALGVEPRDVVAPNVVQTKGYNFLIVSTVEPRKGHAQLLDAFETLWSEGLDWNLTIVGKKGWNVESLMQRIQMHSMLGQRLFYKDFVLDDELQTLYKEATALIVASEGEGFGLPIIEAAFYNLPIIARDLKVFREIAGEDAFYFSESGDDIAAAIKQWVLLYKEHRHPQSKNIGYLRWEDNVKMLYEGFFSF